MSANESLEQYNIPNKIKYYLNFRGTTSFTASLSLEKPSVENAIAETNIDPTLIVAPIFLLVMGCIVVFHKLKLLHQNSEIKALDKFPCKSCHFNSNNSYLKCAVNPSIAFTNAAINCRD